MDIKRKHCDAVQTYLRMGGLPTELDFIKIPALRATHYSVDSAFSKSWGEVFERSQKGSLRLPKNQQMVAVEDDISCVFLWDASETYPVGTKTVGYLKCQRITVDDNDILNSQDSDDFEEIAKMAEILRVSISVDLGLVNEIYYTKNEERDQFTALIFPIGYYVVDPEMGQKIFCQQNAELLNLMFKNNRATSWESLPEGISAPFEPCYGVRTLESVLHALKQYALVSNS